MIDGFSHLWPWDRWRLGAVLICTASCRTTDHTGPRVSVNRLSSSPSVIWWWWWWRWWWQTVPAEPLPSFKLTITSQTVDCGKWLWIYLRFVVAWWGSHCNFWAIFSLSTGGEFFFPFCKFSIRPWWHCPPPYIILTYKLKFLAEHCQTHSQIRICMVSITSHWLSRKSADTDQKNIWMKTYNQSEQSMWRRIRGTNINRWHLAWLCRRFLSQK